jgi:hypothetical protein
MAENLDVLLMDDILASESLNILMRQRVLFMLCRSKAYYILVSMFILPNTLPPRYLHSNENTSILIPGQQRILPILRLRFLHVRPPPQKLFMR